MRFVGYGRMSSDRQNPKSAEDQIFEIKAAGEANGWVFVRGYTDNAMSGSTIFGRTGFEELRRDATEGNFDCIVIEDVDRLSRNLGDLAKFVEYMTFTRSLSTVFRKVASSMKWKLASKGQSAPSFSKICLRRPAEA